jgi:hypothetical protein
MAPWPSVAIETAVIEHPIVLFSSARQICRSGPLPGMRCIRDRWAVWGLPAPTHITRRNELPRRTSALFGCCDRGEGLATDYATSSIVAISWVGPPLTFKIYPDARRRSARKPLAFSSACNAFRSGASRSAINASRSGRLRSAGWLAAHAFASMLRRRGSHPLREPFEKRGPWQTRQRRKRPYRSWCRQLTQRAGSLFRMEKSAWVASFAPQKYNSFSCSRGFDQAALLRRTSRRWEVWPAALTVGF